MGIHDGHRARIKGLFRENGLRGMDDVHALELLLFYAQPRQDTNPLAHTLLDTFGSLDGVLEASWEELTAVPGIGENAAGLLRLIPEISRRYMIEKSPSGEIIDGITAAGRYFLPRFMYERDEVMLALFLDARKRPIACRELSRGTVNATELSTRKLLDMALKQRASSVVLAHNHPSGVLTPSAEDEACTRTIAKDLSLVGIALDDHVIVSGSKYLSLRECGIAF